MIQDIRTENDKQLERSRKYPVKDVTITIC
jgi:hypothetical protein